MLERMELLEAGATERERANGGKRVASSSLSMDELKKKYSETGPRFFSFSFFLHNMISQKIARNKIISSMNSTIAASSMMHSTSLPARCVFSARTSWRTPIFVVVSVVEVFWVEFFCCCQPSLFSLSTRSLEGRRRRRRRVGLLRSLSR